MRKEYIVVRKSSKLITLEGIATSIILSLLLFNAVKFHWAFLIIIIPILLYVILYGFFKVAALRYIMTLLFSMIYGLAGYFIGSWFQSDGVSVAVVFAFAAYFISLYSHKDYFDFFTRADVIEYE